MWPSIKMNVGYVVLKVLIHLLIMKDFYICDMSNFKLFSTTLYMAPFKTKTEAENDHQSTTHSTHDSPIFVKFSKNQHSQASVR